MKIRFLTSGESHGKLLNVIIEGLPAGLPLNKEDINFHLARRQVGYGRGNRMKIEADGVEINSGVRHGYTLGSPVSLIIHNRDWENWRYIMSSEPVLDPAELEKYQRMENIRPGHADLGGVIKYNHADIRNILERSSARETAARVAMGAVCLKLLNHFDIDVFSHVIQISSVKLSLPLGFPDDFAQTKELAERSSLRCIDESIEELMIKEIDAAKKAGDTLGGKVQIIGRGIPIGLGSHVHWDRKLDGLLAQALMSIPAIKAVEIGMGTLVAENPGSKVHDQIYVEGDKLFKRVTNNAGGIEGGISNGSPLIVKATMKPIPTLKKPLNSVNFFQNKNHKAHYERSDVCAVPASGVVCEAMTSYILANVFLDKFSGDSIGEIEQRFNNYHKYIV